MPKTRFGKWSVWLIIAFFLLFILVQIIAAIGRSQGAFDSNSINTYQILMPIIIIPAGICGTAAFYTSIIGIIKYKERCLWVFIVAGLGLFILTFILGEFLFPH